MIYIIYTSHSLHMMDINNLYPSYEEIIIELTFDLLPARLHSSVGRVLQRSWVQILLMPLTFLWALQ